MQQMMMKSAIDIIDSSKEPEKKLPNRNESEKAKRAWASNDALFMGVPVEKILPSAILESAEIRNIDQEFSRTMMSILVGVGHNSQATEAFIKKMSGYAKLYCYAGKKVIRSDDIQTMARVFSPGIPNKTLIAVARTVRSMFQSVKNEIAQLRVNKKIYVPYRHPSLSTKTDSAYPYGQGSYGQSNQWGYGKQSSIEFTNSMAISSGNTIHPFVLVPFSIRLLPSGSREIFCEFVNESFTVDEEGSIRNNGYNAFSKQWYDYFKKHVNDISSWQQSTVQKTKKIRRIFIPHPKKEVTWFSAIVTEDDSPFEDSALSKLEIFLGKNKKIGEVNYRDSEKKTLVQSQVQLILFLGRYMASELAAYAFSSARGLCIPQSCEVPPNGDPWMAFRISGRMSSTPSIAIGQTAVSDNYIVFARDREDSHGAGVSSRLEWEEFEKEARVIHVNDGVLRVMHDSFNYHVDVRILPRGKGIKATLFSDSFNYVDEACIKPTSKVDLSLIGKIALAQSIGVQQSPDYSDMECIVTHVPMRLDSSDAVRFRPAFETSETFLSANYAPFDSLPQDSISYHVNSASTVMYKNSRMNRIRGDLTASLKLFDSQTIDQVHFSEYGTWRDVIASCEKQLTSHFFRNLKKKDRQELFSDNHAQTLVANISAQLDAIDARGETVAIIPEVSEKTENTFVQKDMFLLLRTSPLRYGLSYDVYLLKRTPHKSYNESIVPQEKTFFNSLFSFLIICSNADGHEICIYQPSYSLYSGNYPRHASIGDILCGYLPDFMLWMCREGLQAHKVDQLSSAYFSQLADGHFVGKKAKKNDEELPFSPDASMMIFQKEMVRRWLSYHFPSISRTSSGYHGGDMTVIDHILQSVEMVDEPRGNDDYCPSSELSNERLSTLLRITMLLHDVGKSSISDGGVGPQSADHERHSAALAAKLLPQFFLRQDENESVQKWIYHHSAFEKALSGKFGDIQDAAAHIAKISGSPGSVNMLYHIYRCDIDSSVRDPEDSKEETAPFTAEELLEQSESYLDSSSFKTVNLTYPNSTRNFDPISKFWQNMTALSPNGEKALRSFDIENYYGVSRYSIPRQKFSIEYLLKAESMLSEIRAHPELSFARALGMAYDGPTGSVVRCFQWVNTGSVQNIFLEGMMPYASIDGRSIYASVNEAAPLPGPLHNENLVALLVFDYHCGKIIHRKQIEKLARDFVIMKKISVESSLVSLSMDENDLIDHARIGMRLGYGASMDEHKGRKIICCFDPNRVALITALMVPVTTAQRELSRNFNGSPMSFYDRQHTGRFKKTTLPALSYEDLRIGGNSIQWINDIS